jgi:hypothetical protein
MVDAAEILTFAHKIWSGSGTVTVTADSRKLGMAYAVPKDEVDVAYGRYIHWIRAEKSVRYFNESGVLGTTLVDMRLRMEWEYSGGNQYIANAYLRPDGTLDRTANLNIDVTFSQPRPYDFEDLDGFEIPFHVVLVFTPIGGIGETVNYGGLISARGPLYSKFERM